MAGSSKLADLLDLSTPSVSEVIQSLLNKYENSEIYTWLGRSILLSINPKYTSAQNYSCDNVNEFTEVSSYCWRKPHVFSVAEECLCQLARTGHNQSIIITGTSGSGKTEATKHILHYLAHKSSVKRRKQIAKTETHIENTILQSNPVLEALGNAQTQFNENSSRFGKYIRLIYDRNQILVGAKLQIYLLEKPRALFTPKSLHASFHIFRWFLESLSEEDRVQFCLNDCQYPRRQDYGDAENAEACKQSINDSNWSRLLEAFSSINIKDEKLHQFYKLLTVILLLNSVHFYSSGPVVNIDLNQGSTDPQIHSPQSSDSQQSQYFDDPAGIAVLTSDDIHKIKIAGKLLGIREGDALDHFPQQFLTRLVQAGGSTSSTSSQRSRRMTTYRCACTVTQAREQHNCFIKALYSSLFHFMVDSINKQLNSEDPDGPLNELGILDLFGFECLTVNSFEQYCINYANERLHQTFMRLAVTTAYEELDAEGLSDYPPPPPPPPLPPPPPHVSSSSSSSSSTLSRRIVHENTVEHKHRLDSSLALCESNILTLKDIEMNANLLEEVCLLNRVHSVNPLKLSSSSSSSSNPPLSHLDPREIDWINKIQTVFNAPNCSIHLYDNKYIRSPCTIAKKTLQSISSSPSLSSSPRLIKRNPTLISSPSHSSSLLKNYPKADCDHFIVKHYGGLVSYSISGFVAKNLDRIPIHLLTWVKEEAFPLSAYDSENLIQVIINSAVETANQGINSSSISTPFNSSSSAPIPPLSSSSSSSLHSESPAKVVRSPLKQIHIHTNNNDIHGTKKLASPTNRRINTRRLNTVFGNFKSSLDQLLDVITSHNLFFIRCIRPDIPSENVVGQRITSPSLSPSYPPSPPSIDADYVKDQLVNSGVLAALEVLRSTYYARYAYDEFISEYRIFWQLTPNPPPASRLLESDLQLLNSWYLKLTHLPRSTVKRAPLNKLSRETSESSIQQQQQQFVLSLLTLGLNLSSVKPHKKSTIVNTTSTTNHNNSSMYSSHQIFSTFPIIYQFGRTRIHLTKCQFQHLINLKQFMLSMKAKVIQRFFKRYLKRKLAAKRIQRWWRRVLANRQFALEQYSTALAIPLCNESHNTDGGDDDDDDECDKDSLFDDNSTDDIQSTVLSSQGTAGEQEIQEAEIIGHPTSSSPCLYSVPESIDLPTRQRHIISRRYLPRSTSNRHHYPSETTFYSQYNNTTTMNVSSRDRHFKKQSNLLNYLIPFCYKSHFLKFYETLESVKGLLDIIYDQ
uniref:Myosin motor domain-containing protein n=1 Tax=Trichobilharzia regenti TaxID=157069 RepID=A0AA85K930_TRIRE|nr:unnamed protein product [Trichobilharzia regenti]